MNRLELIRRYVDGNVTREELAALQDALRTDRGFRRFFARYANIDAALGCGRLEPMRSGAAPGSVPMPMRKWVPWMAAAAGLVVGLFSATVVSGYARSIEALMTVPLFDPGFESGVPVEPTGIPVEPGQWGGDFCEVTGEAQGVVPAEGAKMLKLKRADGLHTEPGERSYVGDVAQVIDLRPLRSGGWTGDAVLEFAASFNAIAPQGQDRPLRFGVKAGAYRGEPSEARQLWEEREAPRSWAARAVVADADPSTWQRVSVLMTVPEDAEVLVVNCTAIGEIPAAGEGAVQFPGHYVDDVSLQLQLKPRTSIR